MVGFGTMVDNASNQRRTQGLMDPRIALQKLISDTQAWLLAIERRDEVMPTVAAAEDWGAAIADVATLLEISEEQAEQIIMMNVGSFNRWHAAHYREQRKRAIARLADLERSPEEPDMP